MKETRLSLLGSIAPELEWWRAVVPELFRRYLARGPAAETLAIEYHAKEDGREAEHFHH
jgi:hypothetical protein